MAKKLTLIAGLAALFTVGLAPAEAACPSGFVTSAVNDETGHTFFLYAAPGIPWVQARDCVDDLDVVGGAKAHLATITSSSENDWIVDRLLLTPADVPRLALTQVWVGGFQESVPLLDEPDEGWRWVNSEGPIPVPGSTVTLGYNNWSPLPNLEPNNTGGPSVNEQHLTLGRYATNTTALGLWNDEGAALDSIGGFIVEYDTPRSRTSAGCTTSGSGSTSITTCATVEGQALTFPPGTFELGDSFTFTAYEFTDPRVDASGRCVGIGGVRGPLTLFDDPAFNLPDGPDGSGALVLATYQCGSPKFVVIRAQATNITIPRGVVITESETLTVVPGNDFICNATIPANSSPQQQDVGVWQSLDRTEMWENGTAATSPYARFAGSATELTTACASTLIKTRAKSNFVVGTHIDFGPDVGYRLTAEYTEMLALTKYKVSLVRQSVVDARAKGRISNANGQAMLSQLDSAAAALNVNDPVAARKKIADFVKKVNSSTYSTSLSTPFNYHGDHLSRGENILFTLSHKVIPFKPVP